jgi:hypothetical protein
MKFTIFATLLASTAAFAPSSVERTSSALNMDRRAAFGQIAAAGAVLAGVPAIASADGAVSTASIQRARSVYGDRIVSLKSAVEKGDFAAIADEKSAFILFNSGAYPKDKAKKAAAIAGTNAIFAAIRAGDKAGVKSAYDAYVKDNSITGFPAIDNSYGQGYSSDYDYRVKTKSA